MTNSNNIRVAKRLALFLLAILLAAVIGACGNNGGGNEKEQSGGNAHIHEPAQDRALTDSLGNEVIVPANPERVIASYLEDHLLALGVIPAAQWSVANGIQDYLQDEGLSGVPTISYNLPPEEVLSFSPDFILLGANPQNDSYAQYSKIAPTYVLGDELVKDWRKTLLEIGRVLGKSEQAEQAISDYDAKVAKAKEQVAPIIGDKPVAVLWLTQKQFYLVDEMLSSGAVLFGDLGLTPTNLVLDLPEEAKASWNAVSLEKLAEMDAEYIFLLNSDKGQASELIESPIWQGIPAVKAGRVFELSSTSSWLYSGAIAGEKVLDDLVEFVAE